MGWERGGERRVGSWEESVEGEVEGRWELFEEGYAGSDCGGGQRD